MKQSPFTIFTLIICVSLSVSNVQAQGVDLNNLSSINIDDMSDAQIKSLSKKAEASGYSEEQLILMAKARGMGASQISKLQTRLSGIDDGREIATGQEGVSRVREKTAVDIAALDGGGGSKSTVLSDPFSDMFQQKKSIKVFGQDFFRNGKLSFEPGLNMPTPSNYVLGPGDELIIDIWGASEKSYQKAISPEGSIMIPNLGPIYVAGMGIDKAKLKVIGRLKRIYSSIGSGSHADVSLGKIKSINVHIVGEVSNPGTFTVSSFSTVFNALYSAGGPSASGSMRKIEIFRNGQLFSKFDTYDFLVNGTGENITLQDQDVIIVRQYVSRVVFRGAVKQPAIYELLEEESMKDLLRYSGGYSGRAYKGALTLRRIEGNFKTVKTFDSESIEDFKLVNGDEIVVNSISNKFINRVSIEGPVFNPSEYELVEGMTLKNVIELSNGLKGDAFLDRAIVIRENDDYTLSSVSVDLNEILNDSVSFLMKNNDIIKIQSLFSLRDQYKVRISGQVRNSGSYAFVDGMTVEDLVFLAGGFKSSAIRSTVEVARRLDPGVENDVEAAAKIYNFPINENLKLSEGGSDFVLKPYDVVIIRESPFGKLQHVVKIEGEVHAPGRFVLKTKKDRISDVLTRAGGLTSFAYVQGATLIRKTEYHVDADDREKTNSAAQMRKREISDVFNNDENVNLRGSMVFRKNEALGINLKKILEEPGGREDLVLNEGDVLSIPRMIQTVRVRGEAIFPTNILYKDGASLKYYVSRAGGFSERAKKSKSYVLYANNSARKTSSFFWFKDYPSIRPGSEIIIPSKIEKERKMTVQAWMALTSSMGTLALVINQLVK